MNQQDTRFKAGSTIGIIGGGQLGRMTALAAARMGYHVHIFTPEANSPASEVAFKTTVAAYDDENALTIFAKSVDVVTFEFENIPHDSLQLLEALVPVHPTAKILEISQNRLVEKTFINDLGVATAAFGRIQSADDLQMGVEAFGVPCILKTTTMGYDGKGQVKITEDNKDDLQEIWKNLSVPEAILEAFVPFELEISVIVARNSSGEIAVYSPAHNIHENHILHQSIIPASISDEVTENAVRMAGVIADELELIGLLAVEMFVCKDGKILVNEIAPRPHNSGHWTMDGAATCQFEQLVRAVCNLPLGNTSPICAVEMLNLIGDDVENIDKHLLNPNARIHLYGKKETRAGRKMGHINFLS